MRAEEPWRPLPCLSLEHARPHKVRSFTRARARRLPACLLPPAAAVARPGRRASNFQGGPRQLVESGWKPLHQLEASCDSYVDEPTLFVTRDECAHFGHALTGVGTIYIAPRANLAARARAGTRTTTTC